MKLKIQKFWSQEIVDCIRDLNNALKRMDVSGIKNKLKTVFNFIRDTTLNSKTRVSLCFVLEKIAQFDPFFIEIIEFFMDLLKNEQDDHVKEFAVYILGNLVLSKPKLSLITQTLPLFVEFCKDSSEHVRTCAEELKDQINKVKKTKIEEKEKIDSIRDRLREKINKKIEDMNQRYTELSSEALSLDYEEAHNRQEEMVEKIHNFSNLNDILEEEIRELVNKKINQYPTYQGEFSEDLQYWKEIRAEKEDLIRQIHCILRIHSKIFRIIRYIKKRSVSDSFSFKELKEQTEGGIRGQWNDEEIIETLEKLVEEEIIPNLFLQQVKDDKLKLETQKQKSQ
ncbi:MAG: hypothetical protein R6U96_13760 [Promethearchaeia archaeon]